MSLLNYLGGFAIFNTISHFFTGEKRYPPRTDIWNDHHGAYSGRGAGELYENRRSVAVAPPRRKKH